MAGQSIDFGAAGAASSIGGATSLTPAPDQILANANYLSESNYTFAQQYLPDLYEKEFERYGNRSIASFLRMVSAEGEGLLVTKMPGRIVDVCCEVGQSVEKGDVLIIVEAMKMENPLKAAKAGVITEIYVHQGDLVAAKQKLILVE